MRVTAAVAPRMASGDPAASKGKSAGGASFWQEKSWARERCAATHARPLPAHPVHAVLVAARDRAGTYDSMALPESRQHCPRPARVVNFS
eukprot:COSAG01_NODE_932_length_12651_cov_50.381741_6_plen_90_part_00